MLKNMKRFLILALVAACLLSLPASAFYQWIDMNYSDAPSKTRTSFSNTFSTDCSEMSFYVTNMMAGMHLYNEDTGSEIYSGVNSQDNPTLSYVTASWTSTHLAPGRYRHFATGSIHYIPQFEWQDDFQTKQKIIDHRISRSNADNSVSAEEPIPKEEAFIDRGIEILNTFCPFPENYTALFSASEQAFDLLTFEYFSVMEDMNVGFGDTVPVFFLSEDGRSLIGVKQDAHGVNYKYDFELEGDSWNLQNEPETRQSDVIYTAEFVEACKDAGMPEAIAISEAVQ